MEWIPLSFESKGLIENALKKNPVMLSDYTFTNLWMWNGLRKYQWLEIEQFLCIKFGDVFLYPIGEGNRDDVIKKLAKETESPFFMRGIPENAPLTFPLNPEELHFNYIYLFDDLLTLHGNAYQPKRNLIHQFVDLYPYEYREIDRTLLDQIRAMEMKWFQIHKIEGDHQAILRALDAFQELNIRGGALLVNNQVIAYSFGEYLSDEMLVIHVEKALTEFKGAYQMMNQQLLMHVPAVKCVNREEDLGIPGLKKIKQSYHPLRIEKSFFLNLY